MSNQRERYRAALADPDPQARAVARHQLARLQRSASPPSRSAARPAARWAHVDLAALFAAAGNAVYRRGADSAEAGHEPLHGSRSGRCVLIDLPAGRWWCRSCRRAGDAATFVMDWRGWGYRPAAAWLTARYGPPAGSARRRPWRVVEA